MRCENDFEFIEKRVDVVLKDREMTKGGEFGDV